jgi:hypothetical protein
MSQPNVWRSALETGADGLWIRPQAMHCLTDLLARDRRRSGGGQSYVSPNASRGLPRSESLTR